MMGIDVPYILFDNYIFIEETSEICRRMKLYGFDWLANMQISNSDNNRKRKKFSWLDKRIMYHVDFNIAINFIYADDWVRLRVAVNIENNTKLPDKIKILDVAFEELCNYSIASKVEAEK